MSSDTDNRVEIESNNRELKHLGFVRAAAIYVFVYIPSLYEYVKERSGFLRSFVESFEGVVISIAGPLYQKVKGVPDDVLVFVDKKVDVATLKFDNHAPQFAKRAVIKTKYLIHKTSQKSQVLIHEARDNGVCSAVHHATAESKHFIISQSVKIWIALDNFSLFHAVAELVVPIAAKCSQKYNRVVRSYAEKGYPLFRYLPLIPIDEIAKELEQCKAGKEENEVSYRKQSHHSSSSDSD